MTELTKRLTAAEADYLAECEDTIAAGFETFMTVGNALAAIRENKLYRASHGTFETYCAARWGITDRRARQLIDAAAIGTTVPVSNEAQARELARVPEPQRADVWQAANEATGGKPTAAAIRAATRTNSPTGPDTASADDLPKADRSGPNAEGEVAPAEGTSDASPSVDHPSAGEADAQLDASGAKPVREAPTATGTAGAGDSAAETGGTPQGDPSRDSAVVPPEVPGGTSGGSRADYAHAIAALADLIDALPDSGWRSRAAELLGQMTREIRTALDELEGAL